MKKKKILIVVISIIILLGGLNLFWYIETETTFKPFLQTSNYKGKEETFVKDMDNYYSLISKDGYTYAVKKPDYLSFTGNLSVSKNLPEDEVEEKDDSCSMIIWISPFYEKKYGVTIPTENEGSYEVYITEEGSPIFESSDSKKYQKRCIELLKEHKTEINQLFENKNRVWKE